MKIKKVIGENGPMAQLCNGGQCPAVIVGDDGNAYVQGYHLAGSEAAALTAPVGEGFVRMPLATLRKIAAQVAAS